MVSSHLPSGYLMLFPTEPETDHPPQSSGEVRYACRHTSTPARTFGVWCLIKHKDNFTFFVLRFRSYPPYLEAVSFIANLVKRHRAIPSVGLSIQKMNNFWGMKAKMIEKFLYNKTN